MGSHSASRYVNDVPYTFHFARELTPAWLDFVATLSGFEAPAATDRFAWCELGCGQGLTAAIIAATHPRGEFHAIDAYEASSAMQGSRAWARRSAARLGLRSMLYPAYFLLARA